MAKEGNASFLNLHADWNFLGQIVEMVVLYDFWVFVVQGNTYHICGEMRLMSLLAFE